MKRSTDSKRLEELIKEKEAWKQRDIYIKQLKEQRLLQECTFKPRTLGKNKWLIFYI
jgi:hypothetical protein